MLSYLLLRSNKETGPYSLEELVSYGLKPYDLVWVKGKSAAWRYASEVAELAPYAPKVEEQPFDRFYKKNQQVQQSPALEKAKQAQQEMSLVQEEFTHIAAPVPVYQTKIKEENNKVLEENTADVSAELSAYQPKLVEEPVINYQPKKSVFVTLPGQKTVAVQPPPKKQVSEPIPVLVPQYVAQEEDSYVESQVKYSKPLDEIKEMYVKTLHERKNKIARKSVLHLQLKRAAVVAGLVGVGVLAGFIIKPKSKNAGIASQTQPVSASLPLSEVVQTEDSVPAEKWENNTNSTQASEPKVQPRQIQSVIPEKRNDQPISKDQVQPVEQLLISPEKSKQAVPISDKKEFEQKKLFAGAEKNPVTGERTKATRDNTVTNSKSEKQGDGPSEGTTVEEKGITKIAGKSGLESQVSVSSNDYKRVAFGGIRDLRLTVTNTSKYELDNVIVELQYLKPSEQPLRTEQLQFKFIGPNESSTIRVPDTNRGIKVSYRIISIGSKQARDVAGM